MEKNIAKGKLTKQHINNRGYNKYLKLEGDVKISIDKEKYNADAKWDGLKGYATNTLLTQEEIIENYNHLWQIENAFRISKTDLKIRPIFHRLKDRIEAHICIAFCSYKVYKELERQLKNKKAEISPEKAIDIAKTLFSITIQTNLSNTMHTRLYIDKDEQRFEVTSANELPLKIVLPFLHSPQHQQALFHNPNGCHDYRNKLMKKSKPRRCIFLRILK